MSNNFRNPRLPIWKTITPIRYGVGLGAAGWVDTDLSGTAVGTNVNKLWMVECVSNGVAVSMGVRTHGSTGDDKISTLNFSTFVRVDSSGHVDMYRNAAVQIDYVFVGYFE